MVQRTIELQFSLVISDIPARHGTRGTVVFIGLALAEEKTDQVHWFINIREVLDDANIAPQDYDWYVSDIETNWTLPGFPPADQWFSGELASFLRDHEVQFIWAVFSAVARGFAPPRATRSTEARKSLILSLTAFCSKSPAGTVVEPSLSTYLRKPLAHS